MLILSNEVTYLQYEDDGDERLKKHSIISQHALSNDVRADYPRMIHRDEVKFNDFPFGINLDQ